MNDLLKKIRARRQDRELKKKYDPLARKMEMQQMTQRKKYEQVHEDDKKSAGKDNQAQVIN